MGEELQELVLLAIQFLKDFDLSIAEVRALEERLHGLVSAEIESISLGFKAELEERDKDVVQLSKRYDTAEGWVFSLGTQLKLVEGRLNKKADIAGLEKLYERFRALQRQVKLNNEVTNANALGVHDVVKQISEKVTRGEFEGLLERLAELAKQNANSQRLAHRILEKLGIHGEA